MEHDEEFDALLDFVNDSLMDDDSVQDVDWMDIINIAEIISLYRRDGNYKDIDVVELYDSLKAVGLKW